jgi:predicted flap endonuclease-1-like 5' DNA nuclease/septal ring factor EnvC (AmiA/AmiB activator)
MPEITAALIAFIAGSVAVGAIIGWITRRRRCVQEKTTVSEGWQRQIEAQHAEHGRLVAQNRTLMEQISQLQASDRDATNRARELSGALKEAFKRRDQLQRQLKEIRSSLERALRQRDELQSQVASGEERDDSTRSALKEKDDKIFHLSRELENWQSRLPPLIDRYRERDGEARQLEDELAAARARIDELENRADPGETRIDPVDQDALGDALDASNDPANVTYTSLEEVLADAHDQDDGLDDEWTDEDDAWDGPADVEKDAGREHAAAADVAELHEREPGGLRDNLRLIKGIGPAIEKTLNELGIFRYHQIAEMTEYDVNRVAQRLKGFSSRIYREDWVGQARDLQLRKSGT